MSWRNRSILLFTGALWVWSPVVLANCNEGNCKAGRYGADVVIVEFDDGGQSLPTDLELKVLLRFKDHDKDVLPFKLSPYENASWIGKPEDLGVRFDDLSLESAMALYRLDGPRKCWYECEKWDDERVCAARYVYDLERRRLAARVYIEQQTDEVEIDIVSLPMPVDARELDATCFYGQRYRRREPTVEEEQRGKRLLVGASESGEVQLLVKVKREGDWKSLPIRYLTSEELRQGTPIQLGTLLSKPADPQTRTERRSSGKLLTGGGPARDLMNSQRDWIRPFGDVTIVVEPITGAL